LAALVCEEVFFLTAYFLPVEMQRSAYLSDREWRPGIFVNEPRPSSVSERKNKVPGPIAAPGTMRKTVSGHQLHPLVEPQLMQR
jgi:hypothetical protein